MGTKTLFIIFVSFIFLAVSCGKHKSAEKDFRRAKIFEQDVKGNIVSPLNIKEFEGQWHFQDRELDGVFGVSAKKFYSTLGQAPLKKIIVAVIDSGVDIHHQDLKGRIWTNPDEIPGNGIDDDANGYVDDIHGWNFLGNSEGDNLVEDTLVATRIYKRILTKIENDEELDEYEAENFSLLEAIVLQNREHFQKRFTEISQHINKVAQHLELLKILAGMDNINKREQIESIQPKNDFVALIKTELLDIWDQYHNGFSGMKKAREMAKYYVQVGYNPEYDLRSKIVGDNPIDFQDKSYGNNDVIGPDATHGTTVAGVIAAQFNNETKSRGLTSEVMIMPLRAIPKGDERDKDVALSIRYAVDNGADIINLSFGKSFSQFKTQVDAALLYAAQNNVLVIHAAGNESKNLEGGQSHFPNKFLLAGQGVVSQSIHKNFIEVGASTQHDNENFVASFSNYGQSSVDFFAPGVQIQSILPFNQYGSVSGTSIAAPIVSAMAALYLAHHPDVSVEKLIQNLKSAVVLSEQPEVLRPTTADQTSSLIPLSSLAAKPGVINLVKLFNQ
ncbi:MAG: hypothetical protein CME62_05390 [Halobacteriovoraceae bacterium]|nr:hypothetical protein [Halobacteriovoraceae bacterium]|tara:strand:+ start:19946 stop:21619 length:1674 start_codon:yes stop_codon:yes gene_type:complete